MFGVYIHWPFCLSKCIYCDFGSSVFKKKEGSDFVELQEKYCEYCKRQLLYFSKKILKSKQHEEISSVYFGGGTPSLLSYKHISNILTEINNLFCLSKKCEITLEANPTNLKSEDFYQFYNAGINRLSLGVQSFDDVELNWLSRKHTVEQAITSIKDVKNIFTYWNFDLIYGLPSQSIEKWVNELNFALSLNPCHLSLYILTISRQTPLGKLVELGRVVPKTDDELALFYDKTNFIMKNKNFEQYEVSNYAIKGHKSLHNCCYWKSYDYIGIGPMAHGRIRYKDTCRYETLCKNVNEWFSCFKNKEENGLVVEKKLTTKEQVEEILIMGLRTTDGIDILDIFNRFKIDLNKYLDIKKVISLEKNGFLLYNNNKLKLTYNGLKILDTILKNILF